MTPLLEDRHLDVEDQDLRAQLLEEQLAREGLVAFGVRPSTKARDAKSR